MSPFMGNPKPEYEGFRGRYSLSSADVALGTRSNQVGLQFLAPPVRERRIQPNSKRDWLTNGFRPSDFGFLSAFGPRVSDLRRPWRTWPA